MERLYAPDIAASEVMDYALDYMQTMQQRVNSTIKTIEGLRGGALQNDTRSALMVAELIGSLRETLNDVVAGTAVDLLHMDEPPATNAIARALGISVSRIKAIDAEAKPA